MRATRRERTVKSHLGYPTAAACDSASSSIRYALRSKLETLDKTSACGANFGHQNLAQTLVSGAPPVAAKAVHHTLHWTGVAA